MAQPFVPLSYKNREEWLKLRQEGIGGSDAATACGLNPWHQPYELYLEKTQPVTDEAPSEAAYFGSLLEDLIAQEYAKRTNQKVRRVNQLLRSMQWPWMLANPDRVLVQQKKGLECKATGHLFNKDAWGEPGTDEVPEYYLIQCQHYMAVTGFDLFDLAVLIAGNRFEIYTIKRDDELILDLVQTEENFWEYIKTKTPPPMNFENPNTEALLKKLYPGTNGRAKVLSEEAQHYAIVERRADEGIKRLTAIQKEARSHLLADMGESTYGILNDGTGYVRSQRHRKAYTVSETDYVELRFTEKALEKSLNN